MNQKRCQEAIKQLIADNEDALVLGFYHQGTYRSIADIGTSPLIPPRDFYYFLVLVQSAVEKNADDVRSTRSVSKSVYDCTVNVVDLAITQKDDTVPYETMSNDFRMLCDRIVNLLRSTASFFADDGAKFRLALPDRSVNIRNADRTWSADWSVFYATISFKVEEC